MIISEDIKNEIKNHALENINEECCGFLVLPPKKVNLKLVKAKNVARNPASFFQISPLDYIKSSSIGQIKFVYHSHVNDNLDFSNNDKLNSKKHKTDYILYSVKFDKFKVFGHKRNSVANITKPFEWGVNDCFSTVVEFIKDATGKQMVLPKWYKAHDGVWHHKWPNAIQEIINLNPSFKKINFSEISHLKTNDVLCFSIHKKLKTEDHFGVYLGNGQFHHLPVNKYPISQDLDEFYFKRLTSAFRLQ